MKKARELRNEQKQFARWAVGLFCQNGEIAQLTIENGYGAISLSRTPSKSVTHAIGFGADDDEQDDYDDYENDDEGVQDEW